MISEFHKLLLIVSRSSCRSYYRKDRAKKLVEHIIKGDKSLGHVLRGTLRQYLRFVLPTTDRNKVRWPTAKRKTLMLPSKKLTLLTHFNQETVKDYNLTVFNPGVFNACVKNAGTWIYSNTLESNTQYLGYDFYGFYTGNKSYQLSLDNEYIARPGDTWVPVATRYDI